MATQSYNRVQKTGSEFGGIQPTTSTVQPMVPEALNPGEVLRLGYLTGRDWDSMSLEDRRQMLGLRPASGRRPLWLEETGQKSEAERQGFS